MYEQNGRPTRWGCCRVQEGSSAKGKGQRSFGGRFVSFGIWRQCLDGCRNHFYSLNSFSISLVVLYRLATLCSLALNWRETAERLLHQTPLSFPLAR